MKIKLLLSGFILSFLCGQGRAQMIITTIAGNGTYGYSGDGGPAILAQFGGSGNCISIGPAGDVYVADINNEVVRKINNAGIITTFAGIGIFGPFIGDGGPATDAPLFSPHGVATDLAGNVYITDDGHERVRKVGLTGIISTIAGTGTTGFSGDGGPATLATFNGISYIATDAAGNVYLNCDTYIRKINTAGIITTIAGRASVYGYSGDGGPATAALFDDIEGMVVDGAGNIYIADAFNNRIRKVNAAGIVTTVAGTGYGSYGGDGGPATNAYLWNPAGLALDRAGNLYVGDEFSARLRKIGINDTITTVAGNGTYGFSGDMGPATAAELGVLGGIAIDATGSIYIFDNYTRVRKIFRDHIPYFTMGVSGSITACENSGAGPINALLAVVDSDFIQNVVWSTLSAPKHGVAVTAYTTPAMGGGLLTPSGLSYTPATGYSGNDTFKVLVTDGIASDTIAVYVTINPISSISGPMAVCLGNTTTLSDAPAGGTWHSGNTVVATIGVGSGIVSGLALGTSTIVYTTPAGCTASTTITAGPAALPITGITGICVGATSALTDAGGGTWGSSNTAVATIASSGIYSGIKGGTATITYTLPSGCVATALVTVNAISPITGGTSLCAGATIPLSDAATGGAWSSSNTTIATIGTGSGIVSGLVLGTSTIIYTLSTGCSASTTVTVSPSPTGILGPSGVCAGSSITLSDAVGGGVWTGGNTAAAVSGGVVTGLRAGSTAITYSLGGSCTVSMPVTVYAQPTAILGAGSVCESGNITLSDATGSGSWSEADGSGSAGIGPASGLVTGISAGTVTVSYTLVATGCGASATITVNQTPAAITGTAYVCAAATTALTDVTGMGTWSSGSAKASVSATGIVTGASAGTAIITYKLSTGCLTTDVVTVNALPAAILGPAGLCMGSAVTLSDATGSGGWTLAPGSGNGSVDAALGVVTGISAGTVSVSYTLSTGCAAAKIVTVNALPGAITGSGNVCVGKTTTLSDAGSGTWSATGGLVSVGPASGIVTGITAGTATITYTLSTGCNTTIMVTVNTPPTAITGPASVCAGTAINLGDGISGGTWTLSAGSGNGSVVATSGVVTGTIAGTVTISYTTGAGCSAATLVTVMPAAAPITGATPMCADSRKFVYDADTTAGVWTSAFVTITPAGLVTASLAGAGTITYTLPTGCFTIAPITVYPLPMSITGTVAVCVGSTIQLSDATGSGYWGVDIGGNAGVSGTGIVSGLKTGTAVIDYTLPTGCLVTDTITVYPVPGPITGVGSVCEGSDITLSDTLGGGVWTAIAGSGSVAVDPASGIVTGISVGTATVSYTTAGGCLASGTMSVLAQPGAYVVYGGGSFCAGGAGIDVQLKGSDAATEYTLYDGGTATDSLGGTGALLDFGKQVFGGIYTVIARNTTTGCSNTMSGSAVVVAIPVVVPSVTITAVPGNKVCAGTSVAYTVTPINGGPAPLYQWRVDGAPTGATGTVYNYTPVDGDAVIIFMTSAAPCAIPAIVDTYIYMDVVTPVVPVVSVTATPGNSIAKGQSVTFTAAVTNGVTAGGYQWLLNGMALAGETNVAYTGNNLANGDTVSCTVTGVTDICDANGSGYVAMNVSNVGVATPGLSASSAVTVYPNPVRDELHVTGGAGGVLELFNITGQEVFSCRVATDKEVLHFGYLVPGIYVVRITGSDGAVWNVKMVKETPGP